MYNRKWFLTVLEARESKIKIKQNPCLVRAATLFIEAIFLLSPHLAECGKRASWGLFIKTLISFTPLTHPHIGDGISIYRFWRTQTVYSSSSIREALDNKMDHVFKTGR
jgi:hypothetical protein